MKHLFAAARPRRFPARQSQTPSDDMTVDPVCGMNISKSAVEYWRRSRGAVLVLQPELPPLVQGNARQVRRRGTESP